MLLELLQEPEGFLSEDAVRALGFILSSGKVAGNSSLLEFAVSAASHSGYNKVSRSDDYGIEPWSLALALALSLDVALALVILALAPPGEPGEVRGGEGGRTK